MTPRQPYSICYTQVQVFYPSQPDYPSSLCSSSLYLLIFLKTSSINFVNYQSHIQLINHLSQLISLMEVKNGKPCLPTTYESLLTIRKKNTKTGTLIKAMLLMDYDPSGRISEKNKDQKKDERVESDSDDQFIDKNVVEKITFSDYQRMFDDFENSKFGIITNKMEKQAIRLKQQTPIRTININSLLKDVNIQSSQNIRNLQRQLQSPIGKRNIDKIDTMLCFNKFFLILNREKRNKIYDHCIFMKVQEGEQIYKEGDIEDFMYVVIKGCIRQYEKKSTSYQEKLTVNFITHYEGSNFGDAQLVGDKNQKAKRHHSVKAAEQSYLLKIQNNFYRDLITNSAEDDFERKISSLLSTAIFCETSKIFVTPLLSTLEKKILNFGEVLIRQGQPVNRLYFIGEGNIKLLFIDRSKRNVKHLNIEERPKNFYVRGKTAQKKQREKKNFSIHSTFYYAKEEFQTKKQFNFGKKKVVGDQLEYNDQIVFDEMRTGDFLGGKSFLTPEQRLIRSEKSANFDPNLQSKLTVVGSTTFTTIYSLEQKKFFSLSDALQKMIIDGIMKNPYFDERDIDTKIQDHRNWKKYSQNLVAQVIKEKKSRNNSFRL